MQYTSLLYVYKVHESYCQAMFKRLNRALAGPVCVESYGLSAFNPTMGGFFESIVWRE